MADTCNFQFFESERAVFRDFRDGELPTVRACEVVGADADKVAVEACPHCGRLHWHKAADFDRPRVCKTTMRRYWLEPPSGCSCSPACDPCACRAPEPPGVAAIVRR